jgi:lactate racemase
MTGNKVVLRTAAWYGDRRLELEFPSTWDVTVLWPHTEDPLSDEQIQEALDKPVGLPPIRELCQGKSHPLILVDDLNRPTPAFRVLPFLLRHFQQAGVSFQDIRILMAGGSHGHSPQGAIEKKVGAEAASSCRLLVHHPTLDTVNIGRTSFGTPVLVNREVANSDFVLGIGGIYPNGTAGFGGGSKLALGALDLRSITFLHHRHKSVGWGGDGGESDFRKDLNEIARMIGLNTVLACGIDANRELVRLACGDPILVHPREVAFARRAFCSQPPGAADVVIANAYPNDLSFTFVWMKGLAPLRACAPGASRIAVASCPEGLGSHGVYPVVNVPRFHKHRDLLRRLSVTTPRDMVAKARRLIDRKLNPRPQPNPLKGPARGPENPIWLHHTGTEAESFPSTFRSVRIDRSWEFIIQAVEQEQRNKSQLRVLVYPCAPLQFVEEVAPEIDRTRFVTSAPSD